MSMVRAVAARGRERDEGRRRRVEGGAGGRRGAGGLDGESIEERDAREGWGEGGRER